MFTQPVTDRCAYVLKAHDHAMLGISPFNSSFSRDHLTKMIAWANKKFQRFHLYIPDGPLVYTLLACGYEPAKARKKAKRQINYLFNKINESLLANGFDHTQSDDLILCSKTLETNVSYQQMLKSVEQRFEQDMGFQKQCLATSAWVLSNQTQNSLSPISESADLIAVQYFLAELPLFMDSAAIVQTKSSVFCYSQCPKFVRNLFHDERGSFICENQGFIESGT